ncbi:MAG: hypothetical protein DCC55_27385 [Chloroflexi bacterium]|nr:MAG: hypothetical protein DCC55_27385 [Chloroflexota bacterium]
MPSISNHPAEIDIDWRTVGQLLEAGQYDQVVDLLDLSGRTGEQVEHPLLTPAVAAVHQISLACRQCRADVEWHRQAGEAATHHEDQLRAYAQVFIERIYEWQTGETREAASSDEIQPAEFEVRQVGEPTDWWQRILQRLRQTKQWIRSWLAVLIPLDPRRIRPPDVPSGERAEQEIEQVIPSSVEPAEPTAAPPVETAVQAHVPEPPTPTVETATVTSAPEDETASTPPAEAGEPGRQRPPSLAAYCLGLFRVYLDQQPVAEWPSSKGQTIFKYLVTHRERPVAKEVLMELFWPEAAPDAARNNLNVAIYGLRRALRRSHPDFSHVLFHNDCYLLNPELHIWVDVEEFTQHLRNGRRLEQLAELEEAVREYRMAEALYQGEFLEEDRYEDWLLPQRQNLQDEYLALLDRLGDYYLERQEYDLCVVMTNKIVAIDACREDAQRRLMRCYSRQGHYHLALRQYHLCVEALARELDVGPSQATQDLYEKIQRQQPV